MGRLGIDHAGLASLRPSLIYAALSSQGETGPDAHYVSYGTTLEAMAGLSWITGYDGGEPVASGRDLNYPDQVVALFAAGMIAAAWFRRQRDGTGAHLDISQRELTAFLAGEAFLHPALQERRGNAEIGFVVQDCFPARDGWLAVSVVPANLAALDALLPPGAPHEERLRLWAAGRMRAEGADQLGAAGIAAAPVLAGGEVLAERGRLWHEALAAAGDGRLAKGFPFQLAAAPMSITRDAPQVGADTASVLAEIGGYSPAEIAALIRSGAIECATETHAGAPAAP
jgi:formyl-CoA transferase